MRNVLLVVIGILLPACAPQPDAPISKFAGTLGRSFLGVGTLGVSEYAFLRQEEREAQNKQRCIEWGHKEKSPEYANCMVQLYTAQQQNLIPQRTSINCTSRTSSTGTTSTDCH